MTTKANKHLFLIRGISGSGKSTFVETIKNPEDITVAADDFMVDNHGNYAFNVKKLNYCHAKSREVVEKSMQVNSEKNVLNRIFVHNTFTEEWEMREYLKLAEEYDYQVFSIIVENRHGCINLHGVPNQIIEKQCLRFNIRLRNTDE